MQTGILHLHTTSVILFLLWFGIKTILLLTDSTTALDKLRKYKVADMVLGTLILATGLYLFFNYGSYPMWLVAKLVLVLVFIPLGLVGIKKGNKALTLLSLIGFLYLYGVAETQSLTFQRPKMELAGKSEAEIVAAGEVIYARECVRCHGGDGKMMASGAKNLADSKLSRTEIVDMLKNGKGVMPAFTQYSEQELNAIAAFTETLRK